MSPLYKYKEAVEEQLEYMYYHYPVLRKKQKFARLAGLLSLGPAAAIFLLAGSYLEGYSPQLFPNPLFISLITVFLVGLSAIFITSALIKD